MTLEVWFWLSIAASFLFWGYGFRNAAYAPFAPLPFLIPILLLGWKVFGPAVK
jgi:hypothetical protein